MPKGRPRDPFNAADLRPLQHFSKAAVERRVTAYLRQIQQRKTPPTSPKADGVKLQCTQAVTSPSTSRQA